MRAVYEGIHAYRAHVALLLVVGFIGWRLATRPVLIVVNGLVLPVNVRVNGGETLLLAPGDSVEQPLSRDEPNTLLWEMRRPLTRGGVPVGAGLGASQLLAAPSGRERQVLQAMRGDTAFFAPLITNATGGFMKKNGGSRSGSWPISRACSA